jgi:hypothetical protein
VDISHQSLWMFAVTRGKGGNFVKSAFAPNPYSARLTPHQLGAIRHQIVRVVERGLSDVQAALDGTGEVSPQQAMLFVKLLDKVLPRTRKAPKEEPETSWVGSLSVADLQRLLAETLGEEDLLDDSSATAQAARAPYCERDRREYFRNYESLHPGRKKQREEGRRRRQKSLAEVRARIQARKARQAAEIMPTRAEDNAKRCGLAWKARRQRWLAAERQIKQAQKRKGSRDRHAGPRQARCPDPRQSDHPRSAFVMWRGVRLDRWDTPLTRLVAEATGGQPLE